MTATIIHTETLTKFYGKPAGRAESGLRHEMSATKVDNFRPFQYNMPILPQVASAKGYEAAFGRLPCFRDSSIRPFDKEECRT